jgi:phycocyanobilin:ferredoxin oxidoreductase
MGPNQIIALAAARFRTRLLSEPKVTRLPEPVLPLTERISKWDNLLLQSPKFRRAHVEELVVREQISILHVCIFPHLEDPAPIFGFDVICGKSKATGIFLDLTSVLGHSDSQELRKLISFNKITFTQYRELPQWANIFSSDMLAIRPSDTDELLQAVDIAFSALGVLINREVEKDGKYVNQVKLEQQKYLIAQRQNTHTFRMLSNLTGVDFASHFIENILFPLIMEE